MLLVYFLALVFCDPFLVQLLFEKQLFIRRILALSFQLTFLKQQQDRLYAFIYSLNVYVLKQTLVLRNLNSYSRTGFILFFYNIFNLNYNVFSH